MILGHFHRDWLAWLCGCLLGSCQVRGTVAAGLGSEGRGRGPRTWGMEAGWTIGTGRGRSLWEKALLFDIEVDKGIAWLGSQLCNSQRVGAIL